MRRPIFVADGTRSRAVGCSRQTGRVPGRTTASISGTALERAWTTADNTIHDQSAYTRQIEEFLRRDAASAALQSCLHSQKLFGNEYVGTVQILSLDPLIALVYPTIRSSFWPATPYVDFIAAPDGHSRLAIDAGPNAPATQPVAWFSPDLNVAPTFFPANAATLTLPFKGHSLVLTRVDNEWHTERR